MGGWTRRQWSQLYQWTVMVGGTAALALWRPEWTREPEVLVALIMLFALAEYFPTRVRVGAVTFSFPMAYTGFLLWGAAGGAWVAAVGTLAANVARRRAWSVGWFNAAQFALSALAAGALSRWWPGAPTLERWMLPLLVYIFLYYAINNLIVDAVLLIRLKHYRQEDWLAKNRYEALSASVSFAYAALMMLLAPQQRGHDPWVLTFFFLPLITVGGVVRLLTHLSRFAGQMTALLELSTLVTYAPDKQKALNEALAHLDVLDEYLYAAVWEAEGQELALKAVRGLPSGRLTHTRLPFGEGISGAAAATGVRALAPEAAHDPRNDLGEGIREGAQMLAAFPLVAAGQVLGVLTVGKERSRSLQPEDMRLLAIHANLLAAMLRNVHLAEERELLLLVQERGRLAREIHDGLAQSLAGALLQMDRVERLMDTDAKGAYRLLGMLREQLRELLLEVRRSIWGLRSSPLEARGLVEALQQEVERSKEKGLAGVADVRLEVRGEQRRLSGLVEDEVFRVAQEGLTNALKHAGATEVAIALHFQPDRLRLTIRDNGQGFSLAQAVRSARDKGRFGLTGMSERAARLGASFDVDSRPGAGTRIHVDVPLLGE